MIYEIPKSILFQSEANEVFDFDIAIFIIYS